MSPVLRHTLEDPICLPSLKPRNRLDVQLVGESTKKSTTALTRRTSPWIHTDRVEIFQCFVKTVSGNLLGSFGCQQWRFRCSLYVKKCSNSTAPSSVLTSSREISLLANLLESFFLSTESFNALHVSFQLIRVWISGNNSAILSTTTTGSASSGKWVCSSWKLTECKNARNQDRTKCSILLQISTRSPKKIQCTVLL